MLCSPEWTSVADIHNVIEDEYNYECNHAPGSTITSTKELQQQGGNFKKRKNCETKGTIM